MKRYLLYSLNTFNHFFIMQKRCIYLMATLILSSFGWVACNDIDIVTPPGPRGHSAYEVWVEAVKNGTIVWKEATDLPNYFKYIKGEKGDAGTDAYTIWVQWIKDGSVDNPKVPCLVLNKRYTYWTKIHFSHHSMGTHAVMFVFIRFNSDRSLLVHKFRSVVVTGIMWSQIIVFVYGLLNHSLHRLKR